MKKNNFLYFKGVVVSEDSLNQEELWILANLIEKKDFKIDNKDIYDNLIQEAKLIYCKRKYECEYE